MANGLTWRDVAAPNLSTSMDGMRIAQAGIKSAGDTAVKALGDWDQYQTDAADGALAAALQKFSDPVALQKARADGSLFAELDEDNISADGYKQIDAYQASLLERRKSQQEADQNDKMNPLKVKYQGLVNDGQGLSNEAARETNAFNKAVNPTKIEKEKLDFSEAKLKYDQAVKNRDDTNAGAAAAVLAMEGMTRPQDAMNKLSLMTDLSPAARAIAEQQLQERWKRNQFGLDGQSQSAQGAAAAGASIPGSGRAMLSGLPTETQGYVSKVIVPGGDNSPDAVWGRMVGAESGGRQTGPDGRPLTSGAGAVGAAQVMEGTGPEAAAAAGVPWDRNKWLNDRDYNLKIGRAYFDKQVKAFGGDTLKAAAAYNAGPGRVSEWIAQNGDIDAMRKTQVRLGEEAGKASADHQAAAQLKLVPGIGDKYEELMKSKKSIDELVKEIKEGGGILSSDSKVGLTDAIHKIQNEASQKYGFDMPAAVAAEILKQKGDTRHWYNPMRYLDNALDEDSVGVHDEIARVAGGTRHEGMQSAADSAESAKVVDALKKSYDQAMEDYKSAYAQAENDPRKTPQLQKFKAAVERSQSLLERAIAGSKSEAAKPGFQADNVRKNEPAPRRDPGEAAVFWRGFGR